MTKTGYRRIARIQVGYIPEMLFQRIVSPVIIPYSVPEIPVCFGGAGMFYPRVFIGRDALLCELSPSQSVSSVRITFLPFLSEERAEATPPRPPPMITISAVNISLCCKREIRSMMLLSDMLCKPGGVINKAPPAEIVFKKFLRIIVIVSLPPPD